MKLLSIPTKQFTKVFPYEYVDGEPQLFMINIRAFNDNFRIFQRSFDMAQFEVRAKGHFEVRGKLSPCAIHGIVDHQWKTARDQRQVQRRMLDIIIQAHAYADLRYA